MKFYTLLTTVSPYLQPSTGWIGIQTSDTHGIG